MPPCPICRRRGGYYAEACNDLAAGCPLRVVFPLNNNFFKTACTFYGAPCLARHLEQIMLDSDRLTAAQNMVRAALEFDQDHVFGPFGNSNPDFRRLKALETLCQHMGRSLVLMARSFDAIVARVSPHDGVTASSAEELALNILQLHEVQLPGANVPLSEVDQKFNILLDHVHNILLAPHQPLTTPYWPPSHPFQAAHSQPEPSQPFQYAHSQPAQSLPTHPFQPVPYPPAPSQLFQSTHSQLMPYRPAPHQLQSMPGHSQIVPYQQTTVFEPHAIRPINHRHHPYQQPSHQGPSGESIREGPLGGRWARGI